MNTVNLEEKFAKLTDYWHPRIIGELNDSHVKLAKLKGEFVWHMHKDEDELFFVVKGTLKICIRDGEEGCTRTLIIQSGEFVIIPKGVEHYPIAEEEVHVLLIEPKSTINTGNVRNERTLEEAEWL